MAQVVQTCTLLVTGRLDEVLDPVQRAQKYPAVQLDGLTDVLTKFRFFTFLPAMLALHHFVYAHVDSQANVMLSAKGFCREIGDKASSSGHHLFGNSKQPAVSTVVQYL